MSTVVAKGRAKGIVVRTGTQTEVRSKKKLANGLSYYKVLTIEML
jgi:magnesium-transporting ATPase (P-type)